MALPAGTRLGPYEILELPGVGGSGEVDRCDPRWDPLRDHLRFKRLVGEDWQAEATP